MNVHWKFYIPIHIKEQFSNIYEFLKTIYTFSLDVKYKLYYFKEIYDLYSLINSTV